MVSKKCVHNESICSYFSGRMLYSFQCSEGDSNAITAPTFMIASAGVGINVFQVQLYAKQKISPSALFTTRNSFSMERMMPYTSLFMVGVVLKTLRPSTMDG